MRDRFRKVWPLVKVLLGLTIVVIIGRRFYLDLRGHPDLLRQPLRPGWLLLCGVLYLLGLSFSAFCWHRLMHGLGQRPPFLVALRAYYIGHMGKYLPGKAWALFLRGGLVRGPGVSPVLATITAFYEVFVTMSAGVLVAAVLFALLLPPSGSRLGSGQVREQLVAIFDRIAGRSAASMTPGAPLDRTLVLVLAVALLLPLLLPILPPVFNRLVHHLSLPFREQDSILPKFGTRGLIEGLLATGLGWLCLGASLWAALRGVLPEPPAWSADLWGQLTAIMGVAYVAGFVVLLAPSGLGVREFFLVLFLVSLPATTFAADEASVLLAVLAMRLVWTAAELVMIALVWRLPGPPVLLRKDVAP
jgi:glycosyltransferase 2 family protein